MLIPLKFARSALYVEGWAMAKVTSLSINDDNTTVDTTGADDTAPGTDVLLDVQTVVKTSSKLEIEMIAMYDDATNDLDDAQAELWRKARAGAENVVVERWFPNGRGERYVGIFTSHRMQSSASDGVYKQSASFAVTKPVESIR